ncbi:hypothetical protein BN13_130009 [Nostocoides jenkinsii Ben 74]|uniref:Uncharacterized protein n=1 Tax=Nostocoides jenkinsii Ben 74 TaxID=1193518 RepID=A0A077MAQ2_9MICO|nr:hypothetical protein BN13_130009 [Tetrasphaera jenkinsii Ben 74]
MPAKDKAPSGEWTTYKNLDGTIDAPSFGSRWPESPPAHWWQPQARREAERPRPRHPRRPFRRGALPTSSTRSASSHT